MTPAERAVINAAIRAADLLRDGDTPDHAEERDLVRAVDALKHDDGCICPTDERVYCESAGCHGGDDLPQHDPISGELIPAGHDAELEQLGREMAEGARVAGALVRASLRLGSSDEEEEELATGQDDVPDWVTRTWRDVRAGDDIRITVDGQKHTSMIMGTNAPGGNRWHVHPAADEYHPELSQVDWTEICVRLEGRTDLLSFDPAGPIEILLSRTEVDAIELLSGWDARVSVTQS